jgi:hypothetical protein
MTAFLIALKKKKVKLSLSERRMRAGMTDPKCGF